MLYKLNTEELGYDFPLELTEMKLKKILQSPSDGLFAAELAGQLVGYIHVCGYELLYASSMVNVLGIAVSSQHRRQGIGRALLEAAERWAKERGAEGVRLNSGEERAEAHEFYKSMGYSCKKKQLNFSKIFG